jgi:hypothetical protein
MRPEKASRCFVARIYKVGINRCVDVPKDFVSATEKRGYIPVSGSADGISFRSTLLPGLNQMYRLFLHSRIWKNVGLDAGDVIEITLERDQESRDVALPEAASLAGHRGALAALQNVTPGLRREFIKWVVAAKHPATRERRIRIGIPRLIERARRRSARTGRGKDRTRGVPSRDKRRSL